MRVNRDEPPGPDAICRSNGALPAKMNIKSIGPVSAAVPLGVIGNIQDFADAGKLAAYSGLGSAFRTPMKTAQNLTNE